jgi:hypothetical protein
MANMHVDKFIKKSSLPIHFIRGKDNTGRDCFFFLICNMDKIRRLQGASENGNINLLQFGQVIASGFGRAPDQGVCKMLKEKYDFLFEAA